jgi:hypothetical protein
VDTTQAPISLLPPTSAAGVRRERRERKLQALRAATAVGLDAETSTPRKDVSSAKGASVRRALDMHRSDLQETGTFTRPSGQAASEIIPLPRSSATSKATSWSESLKSSLGFGKASKGEQQFPGLHGVTTRNRAQVGTSHRLERLMRVSVRILKLGKRIWVRMALPIILLVLLLVAVKSLREALE